MGSLRNALRIKNQIIRDMLAEFIGTYFLVTFAVAAGAQYVLTNLSSFLTLNFANGMGLVFGIYAAGGVSGASLNPAVSLGLCLRGDMPWYKYPFYTIANIGGAFTAAAVQYGVNYDMLNAYDGGNRTTYGPTATAGIFSTFPNPDVSNLNCFFDQVFGTFILVICIFTISDKKNFMPQDKGLIPIAMGSIVFAIGTCWAGNCGYAINPGRDFGPRLFTLVAGWGIEPFSYRNYSWFWIPIVGPLCGAVVAYIVYQIFIGLHYPPEETENAKEVEVVVKSNGVSNSSEKSIAVHDVNGKEVELTGVHNLAFVDNPKDISTSM